MCKEKNDISVTTSNDQSMFQNIRGEHMPLLKQDYYTIQDIYALPDGQRAELIDGEIYDMTSPKPFHQELLMQLSYTIHDYIKKKKGKCKVYPAPFAVFIKKDEINYVEPDISVICDTDKISDRGCEGCPDLIIEIVSPSSRKMDYSKKNALYAESGVREYWIVDPDKRRTTIYRWYEENSAPVIIPFDETAKVGIYDDLEICIAELLSE